MCWITDRRGELATTFNKQLIFCHWQLLTAPNCHLLKDRLWIYVTFGHGKIMDNQCRKRGDSWISNGVCHIGNPILEILKGCSTLASSVLVRENFKLKPQEKAETNFYEYPLHNEFLNSTSGHKFRTTVRRCCKILWVPGCIFSIIHLGLRNL